MLIKLALPMFVPNPFAVATDLMVGSNLHDIGHLMTARSNRFGKYIQSSALSDSIIAAKKATEGKSFANKTLTGLASYNFKPQNMLLSHEVNQAVHKIPGAKHLIPFDKNRLNVKSLRARLKMVKGLDNALVGTQVALPVAGYSNSYYKSLREGHDTQEARKAGLKGASVGLLASAGMYVPRKLIGNVSSLHNLLSKDKEYGYGLLEQASRQAETVMNRPKWINYAEHAYKTPEENAKARVGSGISNFTKRLMGQERPTRFSVKEDRYIYPSDEPANSKVMDTVKKLVDGIPAKFGFRMR